MHTPVFYFLLCFCFPFTGFAQNLVPNPSFEDYLGTTACGSGGHTWTSYTTGVGSCTAGSGTFQRLHCTLNGGWYEPGGGSTDVYTTCNCTATGTGTFRCQGQNTLFAGDAVPMQQGSACIWLRNYGLQDYLAVPLSAPLEQGKTYDISVWLRLSPRARFQHDGFGILFTPAVYTWGWWSSAPAGATDPKPQFPATPFMLSDAGQWVEVAGTYTVPAGSDLTHLTLGTWKTYASFSIPANSLLPDASSNADADYFVDNLSITEASILSADEIRLHGISTTEGHWLSAYSSTEWLQVELQHSHDGQQFQTLLSQHSVPGDYLQPASALAAGGHYYRLRCLDWEGTAHYSPVVFLRAGSPAPRLVSSQLPAAGGWVLQHALPNARAHLLDPLGRQHALRQEYPQAGSLQLVPPGGLSSGLYFLSYADAEGQATYRVWVP
ncbi:MAG: hypothetical protein KF690_01120 [Bacteroidetes bacterium]|nr:hypothetical protein [Bacteroidota bacterium]